MSIVFQRQLSPFLTDFFASRAAQDSRNYNSQFAVEIVLQDATVLRYGTAQIVLDSLSRDGASVTISPLNFVAKMDSAPDVRVGQTRAPDIANVSIFNLDYLISAAIPDSARVYDNCRVHCYLCFRKPSGSFEGIDFFSGPLVNLTGDDQTAELSATADLSSKTALAGKEMPQRCLNELGDGWCGVPPSTLPVGAVCSKEWSDKASGCLYWGGVFNGAPFINPSALVAGVIYSGGGGGGTGGGGTGGDGGGGDGGGWEPRGGCPDEATTIFERADGAYIAGRDLQAGETIKAPNNKLVTVNYCERIYEEYRYLVQTRFGARLIISAKHVLLRSADDMEGKVASEWKFSEWGLLCSIHGKQRVAEAVPDLSKRDFNYSFKPVAGGTVLKLNVSEPNSYWAGMDKGLMIGNHNKPIIYEVIY